MRIINELLSGVLLIEPKVFTDSRGNFLKTFHSGIFKELGIPFVPMEEFYSTSHQGVLRGMHFQLPPHDHAKLVYCLRGRVLDVMVDLRKNEPTFGRFATTELSAVDRCLLYLPTGIAHGFLALEPDSVMVYKTSTVHAPSHDAGIRWDSFGFDWGVADPLISPRDAALPRLVDFVSPF